MTSSANCRSSIRSRFLWSSRSRCARGERITLAFISGPHGGGKTTLVEKLKCVGILFPDLRTVAPKFHTMPLERITLKLCERAIENYEIREMEKNDAGKIYLGNRCIYDADAYALAYNKVGWINDDECDALLKNARAVFPQDLHEPYAIVLNPPAQVIKERLSSRWSSGEKKWKEDDFSYLEAACKAYEQLEEKEEILYIRDNDCVQQVVEWLTSLRRSR